jgi:hypothetical protein
LDPARRAARRAPSKHFDQAVKEGSANEQRSLLRMIRGARSHGGCNGGCNGGNDGENVEAHGSSEA